MVRSLSVNEPPEGFVNTLKPLEAPPYNATLDVPLVCNDINASPAFLLTFIFVAANVATPSDAMRSLSVYDDPELTLKINGTS